MNEFVIQLDEEVEGMQATICTLQQQLKESALHSEQKEMENKKLRTRVEEIDSSFKRKDINNTHMQSEDKRQTLSNLPSTPTELVKNHVDEKPNHSIKLEAPDDLHEKMETETAMTISNLDHTRTISLEGDSSRTISLEVDSSHLMNQVKVIRGTDESKRDLDCQSTHHYVSPNKGSTKTSFSITDLLSSGKDSIKKEPDVTMDVHLGIKCEENAENGILNGEIDDTAI